MNIVKEAYKEIEMDKDPVLRKKRERAETSYDKPPDDSPFQSRRPKSRGDIFGDSVHQEAENMHATRWMRKFQFQQFRNDFMPVHPKNVDRHGLQHLEKEKVKVFDRLKIPVPFLFFGLMFSILYFGSQLMMDDSLNFEKLSRKAKLNAVKKHQHKLEYEDDEITPVEKSAMETQAYKLQQKEKKDVQKALKTVKDKMRYQNYKPKEQEIIRLADKR